MNYFDTLNTAQQNAVKQLDGPIMVIAGAGSGKTRVLTYKIAYLLHNNVDAFNIMALTFTNKAAREMRERVFELVKDTDAKSVWMGTFHSVFSRLLRRDGHLLGYNHNYTIYDTDDSRRLIKKIVKDFNLDNKIYDAKTVLSRISAAKSSLISAKEYNEDKDIIEFDTNFNRPKIGKIYAEYQKQLFRSNAMDFDDILFNFYIIINNFEEVLNDYQQRFKYILIDEFQDTNKAQYEIVKKLALPENNLCVVGDDAQSIYAFRGANIANILGFTKDYPNYKIFKLEQNYRSSNNIVQISNSIINKNKNQIKKKLWTDNHDGDKIKIYKAISDNDEASKVVSSIFEKKMNEHCNNNDFAILYRTNAQSRNFEDALRKMNIPYIIYGGVSFYQRKEIKDVLAYFRLIINHQDEEALNRIINYPTRGIGNVTLTKIYNKAFESNKNIWEVVNDKNALKEVGLNSGTISKVDAFTAMIKYFSNKLSETDAGELAKEIVRKTGIIKDLTESEAAGEVSKVENIESLINAISDFTEQKNIMIAVENEGEITEELVTLDKFMQDVALLTDSDISEDKSADKVQLMTIHSAKGLEFPHVFVVGMEEELFPSQMSMYSREELEEERRLFYVACTRAEKTLTLSYAEYRYRWGEMSISEASRFLKDIDYTHVAEVPADLNRKQFSRQSIHGFSISENKPQPNKNRVLKPLKEVKQQNKNDNAKPWIDELKVGNSVLHKMFGRGVVKSIEGVGPNKQAKVEFEMGETKVLMLHYANLQIIN